MRVTSKGQVTIPVAIRERLGLRPGCRVEFAVEDDSVRITRARDQDGRGRSLLAPLRGSGTVRLTTDEIMAHTRGE